jgi:hypothetical protein
MDESNIELEKTERPSLWNPNAAAMWSLLLTPAFGAYLHAANWRTLGDSEHAKANKLCVWLTFVFMAVIVGTLFIPESKVIDKGMRVVGIGLMAGWYFGLGRAQAQHLKEVLGNHYVRKGWGLPLLIAVGAIGAYAAVIFFVVELTYKPDPAELADQVKPLILEEWHKTPELRGATIINVTLVHREGNVYSGFVDAKLAGHFERLALEVTYEANTIAWEIKPIDDED